MTLSVHGFRTPRFYELPYYAMDKCLSDQVENLKKVVKRLQWLQSQDELVILKHSLSLPKPLFTLRCSPCMEHNTLQAFDDVLKESLSKILNISLESEHWTTTFVPDF